MTIENDGTSVTDHDINHAEGETDGSLPDGGEDLSLDEQAERAFAEGVKAAEGVPDDDAPAPDESDEEKKGDAKDPASDAGQGDAGADGGKPGDKQPAEKAPAKPEPDASLDTEVKSLGLKGKAEARFREMSSELKSSRPVMETLTKLDIKTPEQLKPVLEAASRCYEFEDAIQKTSATPEQFSSMMNVIGAMNSGDPKLLNACYDAIMATANELGRKLGRDVPGHDPLDAHPDLKQAVDEMSVTREYALEIAKSRQTSKLEADRAAQTTAQNEQTQELTRAQQKAVDDVRELVNEWQANDPAYEAKAQALVPTIEVIKQKFPVTQWALEISKAYNRLKIAAPAPSPAPATHAPARVRPGNIPARVTGNGTGARREFKSDMEAFMAGVADASR